MAALGAGDVFAEAPSEARNTLASAIKRNENPPQVSQGGRCRR